MMQNALPDGTGRNHLFIVVAGQSAPLYIANTTYDDRMRLYFLTPLLSCFLATFGSIAPALAGETAVPPPWDYNSGSERWANLGPDYAPCAMGIEQSPVDIDTERTDKKTLPSLQPRYSSVNAVAEIEPVSIRIVMPVGQKLVLGKETYELKEIRFHSPSEHSFDFKEAPAELQLVHRAADGARLNVAVLLHVDDKAKPDNQALENIWAIFKPEAPPRLPDIVINAKNLLPKKQSYFRYTGSLTTPPCTEGVTWLVMRDSMTLSREQFRALTNTIGRNSRETQKLGNRTVEESN